MLTLIHLGSRAADCLENQAKEPHPMDAFGILAGHTCFRGFLGDGATSTRCPGPPTMLLYPLSSEEITRKMGGKSAKISSNKSCSTLTCVQARFPTVLGSVRDRVQVCDNHRDSHIVFSDCKDMINVVLS